jgi:hypothetical protein
VLAFQGARGGESPARPALFLGTKRAKRKYYYVQNEPVVEKAQQDPHCFWGQNERNENIIMAKMSPWWRKPSKTRIVSGDKTSETKILLWPK